MPDPGKRDPRSQNFSAYSRANMLQETRRLRRMTGIPQLMAKIHAVQFEWTSPAGGQDRYATLAAIVSAAYNARGGEAALVPCFGSRVGKGRADIRLGFDGKGEIYIISKSDGTVREVVGAIAQ